MDISLGDAKRMFEGCLLQIGADKGYTLDISSSKVRYISLEEPDEEKVAEHNDYEIFSPIKERLGFVQAAGVALLTARSPMRQWKVGLTTANTRIRTVGPRTALSGAMLVTFKGKWPFYKDALPKCFAGDYPTLLEAMKAIEDGAESVAFDRQFCVHTDGNVYYLNHKIGATTGHGIEFAPGNEFFRKVCNVD